MDKQMNVTSSPHFRARIDTQKIMLCVILALMPATIFGIWNFGLNALVIVIVTIVFAVLSELVYELIVHKKPTIKDLSAVLTGLLLALNMPAGIAWWIPALGAVFAIIVVKMLFGGLGQNFMNPALGARCFLLISFAGPMTNFLDYQRMLPNDVFSSATPLAVLKDGNPVDTLRMLIGTTPGTIGETSVICLLIGAIFLILMGIIDLRIPGSYIGTFLVFILIYAAATGQFTANYIVGHLCGGGLMLGAFFMATDYVTSPITPSGKLVFGVILGVLTAIFRLFGAGAEGVSYAIIIGNIIVPLIENKTVPRAFGVLKVKKEKKQKGGEA